MRLLVITQYFWPEEFRINDLVSELDRKGHQITVLTAKPNYPDGKIFTEYKKHPEGYMKFGNVKVLRVPIITRGDGGIRLVLNFISFAVSATVLGLWKLRGEKYDSIFAYQPSPITVAIPAIALRAQKKIPFLFWVLDLWPETLQAIGVVRSKFLLSIVGRLVSFIYKRCDLVLAQSKSFVSEIERYSGDNKRIEYFPSWSESHFESQDCAVPAQEISIKPGCFNIMFAGNIGDAQDFPSIIKAAELLKDHGNFRWLIVGDGRQSVWVKNEIKKKGLEDSFFMLGRHPIERMPEFFKHADALLVTLKDEPIFSYTIPGKFQAYLATGVPVLAMLNGEGSEVINQSKSGIACAAGNFYELAAAAKKLSEMTSDERSEMGKNGVTVSKTEFDRDRLISQLESWLEKTTLTSDH